ncbi:MAG: T9SS type A sorting domain-containing protein, partial [Cytophagaceae bacterium]|nr:T9SS type A sorting domain-containing protein [Cytophagaceae bacterium]
CSAKFNTINISDIDAPELSIVSIVGVNCPGESTGSATLEIISGIHPVTVEWPDGQTGLSALNLPGEKLDVVVKDGNGCKVFFPVSIPTPAPFHFDINKQLPNCKGECNGAISVNVTGGTSPYTYSWNGTTINIPSLTDICPDNYKLNILDQRNCDYSEEIELPDQAPLTANLQDTVTLCVGQQIELNAGNPGSTYTWTRNGTLISNHNSITATDAGQYVLLLQDLKGCQGRDTLELITSTSFLQADFLMTSKAIVGDTIVLFEISSPAPESIHWTFDANALVYNNAGDIQQVIFSNAGTYPIMLEARLAECYDDVVKYITIYESQDDLDESNPLGFKEASLISFIAYPNPNSGDFQTTIELTEEQDIELRMANLITSEVVFERKETGKSKYDFQFNQLKITPGFYVLSLKAGDKYKTLKILVQ